jgi:hypothetical protein
VSVSRSTIIVLFQTCLALAACQQTEVQLYQRGGKVRIDPTNIAGADYVVQIRNEVDIGFGFNPNIREQRNSMALRALKTQCPAGHIIKEDVIELGGPGGLIPIGGDIRTYLMYVKCR